jgi:hypothetical protein
MKAKRCILLIAFCFMLWQCSRDEVPLESSQRTTAPYEVTLDEAVAVAEKYALTAAESSKGARIGSVMAETKETVADEKGKALFHIINFEAGGFVIVSADTRAMPILAYSTSGNRLDAREAASINGLALWFDSAKKQMKDIGKGTDEPHAIVQKEWKKYLKGKPDGGRTTGNTNCEAWYTTGQYMCQNWSYFSHNSSNPNVPGPLLSFPDFGSGVSWGQDRIANFKAPTAFTACYSPETASYCGRYPAGCGPVAMAQVLWYYHRNTNATYSSMPQLSNSSNCTFTASGEVALADLMRECGNKSSSIYGLYSTCNTLTYPWHIPLGLQNMGLSNGGTYTSYAPSVIKAELYQGNPVILHGTNSDPMFTGFNQHIWVCDGFNENNYRQYNCDTNSCDEWSYLQLYMNWGWDGRGNAWYAAGNFRPNIPFQTNGNYNQNLHMIKGIRK